MSDLNHPEPSVEEMIAAAGDFLQVDPFLRPDVVEQATAVATCNKAWRRGGIITVAVLCVIVPLALVTPADSTQNLAIAESSSSSSANGSIKQSDNAWGMLGFFQRLQAERLRIFTALGK